MFTITSVGILLEIFDYRKKDVFLIMCMLLLLFYDFVLLMEFYGVWMYYFVKECNTSFHMSLFLDKTFLVFEQRISRLNDKFKCGIRKCANLFVRKITTVVCRILFHCCHNEGYKPGFSAWFLIVTKEFLQLLLCYIFISEIVKNHWNDMPKFVVVVCFLRLNTLLVFLFKGLHIKINLSIESFFTSMYTRKVHASVKDLAHIDIWREIYKYIEPVSAHKLWIYKKTFGLTDVEANYVCSKRTFTFANKNNFTLMDKVTHIHGLINDGEYLEDLLENLPESLNFLFVPNYLGEDLLVMISRALKIKCPNLNSIEMSQKHFFKSSMQRLPIKNLVLKDKCKITTDCKFENNFYCKRLSIETKCGLDLTPMKILKKLDLILILKHQDINLFLPESLTDLSIEAGRRWVSTNDIVNLHFGGYSNLKRFSVNIHNTVVFNTNSPLNLMKKLEYVHLQKYWASDVSFDGIRLPQSVKTLFLADSKICDNFLQALPKSITKLELMRAESLTDFSWINNLTSLVHLSLNDYFVRIKMSDAQAKNFYTNILPKNIHTLECPNIEWQKAEYSFYEQVCESNIKTFILKGEKFTLDDLYNNIFLKFMHICGTTKIGF
jgi:hypothetical protein